MKASFHESGKWHTAYSQKTFEESVRGAIAGATDRFMEKWCRPPEIAPGVTLGFRIVTPWLAVTIPLEKSGWSSVIWVPNATEPKATEMDILFVDSSTPVTGWPGKRSMGTSLIGFTQLESGETVWVVHRVVDMPDFTRLGEGSVQFYKGMDAKDLKQRTVRGLLFGTERDGSRVIFDLAGQVKTAEIK